MCKACWIPKATNTHSQYVRLTAHSTAIMVTRTPLNVTFIRKQIFERKRSVLIFSTSLSDKFLFLRKTEPHVIKHVYWSLCKVTVILVRTLLNLNFFAKFSKNKQILMLLKTSNLMLQCAKIYSLQSHSTCFGCYGAQHQEY
jgi:hypothetical protein